MSERQRLADKLNMEHWDDELLALFALQKIDAMEVQLRQALRQWKMYAEMQEERDLLTETSPEAEMYRAALAVAERRRPAMSKPLDPCDENDRLEIATQLYERFCADLVQQSDKARVRLVSGIQVALRDAAAGETTPAPFPKPVQ